MSHNIASEVAAIGVRLLDDAYMSWLAAESESSLALRAWLETAGPRHEAYFTYLAALDREQAAALDLQRLSTLAAPCRRRFTEQMDGSVLHPERAR
jgi:hypothetical protein